VTLENQKKKKSPLFCKRVSTERDFVWIKQTVSLHRHENGSIKTVSRRENRIKRRGPVRARARARLCTSHVRPRYFREAKHDSICYRRRQSRPRPPSLEHPVLPVAEYPFRRSRISRHVPSVVGPSASRRRQCGARPTCRRTKPFCL